LTDLGVLAIQKEFGSSISDDGLFARKVMRELSGE